jgi:hypothetical protein
MASIRELVQGGLILAPALGQRLVALAGMPHARRTGRRLRVGFDVCARSTPFTYRRSSALGFRAVCEVSVLALALLPIELASSQEALRGFVPGEAAAEQLRDKFERAPCTMRRGDLKVLVEPSLSVAWSDNTDYSSRRREEDIILRPQLGLTSLYPVGQRNTLRLCAIAGYEQFVRHEDYSRLVVEPGSELCFDIFVKEVRINLHERFAYQLDAGRSGEVSGLARFGGIDNAVGGAVIGELQGVGLSAGYDYCSFMSSSSRFAYLDRGSHRLVGRAGLDVHPAVSVGLEWAGGSTEYCQQYLSDHMTLSVGPYARWEATRHITIQPRGGYVLYRFSSEGFAGKPGGLAAVYFGLRMDHRITPRVSYVIDAGRHFEPGVYANLVDLWTATGQAKWSVAKDVSLFTWLSFEKGTERAWFITGAFERVGAGAGLGYRLMKKLQSSLEYRLLIKEASLVFNDYTQNRVTVGLNYCY